MSDALDNWHRERAFELAEEKKGEDTMSKDTMRELEARSAPFGGLSWGRLLPSEWLARMALHALELDVHFNMKTHTDCTITIIMSKNDEGPGPKMRFEHKGLFEEVVEAAVVWFTKREAEQIELEQFSARRTVLKTERTIKRGGKG